MKIPHVRVVTGELDGQNEAAILIEVDDQKNVDSVTRQLPSKIEGFPVEVDEGPGDYDSARIRGEIGHWGGVDPTPSSADHRQEWLLPSHMVEAVRACDESWRAAVNLT